MSTRFSTCLKEVLTWEGGFSNDPADPGGATNRGITWRVYDAYRTSKGQPLRHVREIEAHEWTEIYLTRYWQICHADKMPPGLDLALFDYGVNCGPITAVKNLQRVLGVEPDGHYGYVTAQAVADCDVPQVIAALCNVRRDYYRSRPHFWRFGRGWLNRTEAIEAMALSCAPGSTPVITTATPKPLADPVQQSATQGKAQPKAAAPGSSDPMTNGARITGGFSVTQIGLELGTTLKAAFAKGQGIDWLDVALRLASSPTAWAAAIALFGSIYVIAERNKSIKELFR